MAYDDQEGKEDVESAIAAQNKRLEGILDEVTKSMEKDDSIANTMYNYGKLRDASSPHLGAVKDLVKQMKEGWDGIMAQVDAVSECGEKGKKMAKNLRGLYYDYWDLLLTTNTKLGKLIPQAQIQKECIKVVSDIVEQCGQCGIKGIKEDQLEAYRDCLGIIQKWIDTKDIETLVEKWGDMSKRIGAIVRSEDWKEIQLEAGKYKSKATWQTLKKVGKIALITLGIIGVIAGVAAIVFFTAGAGAPVAAGATAVAVETAVGVSTSAIVGTSVAVGGAVLAASFGYGYFQAKKVYNATARINNDINAITKKLQGMIAISGKMTNKLNEMEAGRAGIEATLGLYADSKSRQLMNMGLKRLDNHLDEFIKHGCEAQAQIKKALKDFCK